MDARLKGSIPGPGTTPMDEEDQEQDGPAMLRPGARRFPPKKQVAPPTKAKEHSVHDLRPARFQKKGE